MASQAAITLLDRVKPLLLIAAAANPTLATMYPGLAPMFNAPKLSARQAQVTKKKNATAAAASAAAAPRSPAARASCLLRDVGMRVRLPAERRVLYPDRLYSASPPDGPAPPATPQPAHDLLDAQELSRARLFALLAVVIPVNVLLLLPFLGGDRRARELLGVNFALCAIGSAWLLWSLFRDERYQATRLLLVGTLWLAAGLAGVHFFGVFSPVATVLALGVLFFGMTRDVRLQTLGYLAASCSYFALAVAALRAHGGDPGIVGGSSLTPMQSIVMVVLAEIVLLVTFVGARAARATTVLALARCDRTARLATQKDALIVELQRDLARALEVGGVGRFSDTVVGSYALGEVIGRGAMGEVYGAVHQQTRQEVAVKILHAHTLREPGSVERFLREAKMAAALETPHAVRILEVGGLEGDLPYLAMERLHGDDLAELLRREGRLGLPDLLRLLSQVGAGLAALRKVGVVHRDIKPRNVFLCRGDRPGETVWKLLDFGLSEPVTADVTHADGRVVGTPEYMAPEQAAGQAVTHRTDLFSLGAVVYRALTGSPAFAGDHIAEVLYRVTHAMPPRPSAIADLRPEVDLVLAVALAKDPMDRFDTAEELRDALEAAARGAVTPDLRARAAKVLAAFGWSDAPRGDE
jgi:serine/threonine-protein kinase